MILYYIYEIPGEKVGCTKNLYKRVKIKQNTTNYNILHITNSIKIASKREKEYQQKLGYKVDNFTYDKMLIMQSKIDYSKRNKNIDWSKVVENRNIDYSKRNIDYKASRAKINWDEVKTLNKMWFLNYSIPANV
jgi:hypothetical protein